MLQSGTDSTTATATCSGDAATRLDITGGVPPAYGTYTGTIKLGGSDVQLSVTNAAGWLWPILIAGLALLIGLLVRGYLVNRRPIGQLIAKAERL